MARGENSGSAYGVSHGGLPEGDVFSARFVYRGGFRQRSGFRSAFFTNFLFRNGVQHVTTPCYHPSSNGQVERYVQTVKNRLRKLGGSYDWAIQLPHLLLGLHVTPHATTHLSPAELLHGRKLRTILDLLGSEPVGPEVRSRGFVPGVASGRSVRVRGFRSGAAVFVRSFSGARRWIPGEVSAVLRWDVFEVRLNDGRKVKRHVDHMIARWGTQQGMSDARGTEQCGR